MARARIDDAAGSAAVAEVRAALAEGGVAPRTVTATAVRWLLQVLADGEPGATVEVFEIRGATAYVHPVGELMS